MIQGVNQTLWYPRRSGRFFLMRRLVHNVSQLGLPLLCLWAALFVYFFVVLHSLFFSGKFGYEDLTLLNSIFSNTVYGRGFFLVTHDGFSHFRLQFTPTLLFLVPFYRVFESQFILVALGNTAFYLSILVFLVLFQKILARMPNESKNAIPKWVFTALPFVFLLLMSSNRYAKNVLASGHYEIFYLLLWSGLAYVIFENKSWFLTIALFLLTVGLRSDSSFFLFFQLVALNFIPSWTMKNGQDFKVRVRLLAAACLIYFLVLVALVNPALGAVDNFTRWWGHLGNTPFKIITTVITSPKLVISSIIKGGFLDFNLSFFFLSLFHPFYFLFINLPAIPNYLMLFPDRNSLFCYHSGVFLPTLYLGSFLGLLKLFGFCAKRWNGNAKRLSLFCGVVLSVIVVSELLTWTNTNNGYRFKLYPNQDKALALDIDKFLSEHPEVKSVAADWGSIVYTPNSIQPRVLDQYEKVDLVILPREARPLLTGFGSYSEAKKHIQMDSSFHEVYATERVSFLQRANR